MPIAILIGVYALLLSSLASLALMTLAVWMLWRARIELNSIQKNSLGFDQPIALLKELSETVKSFSAFLPGMTKIAQEQIKSTMELESAVTAYTRLNFGVDTPKKNMFTDIAEQDEITRVMAEQGLAHEEAEQEVKRQRIYGNFSLEDR